MHPSRHWRLARKGGVCAWGWSSAPNSYATCKLLAQFDNPVAHPTLKPLVTFHGGSRRSAIGLPPA